MRVDDLCATIAAHPDPDGDVPAPVCGAITTLARRLEALVPGRATAELVAARVGVQPRGDGSLLLLWSSVVWGAFYARSLPALHAAVRPLLPAGEAYTAQEMADERALAQLADVEGRPDEVAEHEARVGTMVVHNALVAG